MNKKRRYLVAGIILLGMCFLWTDSLKAWQPPKKEDEAAFLKWYEEHKDIDGAYYRLTGNLYLTGGDTGAPAVFDGTGKVTIDCGGCMIVVNGEVTVDNPNLNIYGEGMFLFMVRTGGALALSQGTLEYGGTDGTAVYAVSNGIIVPPAKRGGLVINAHGYNVTAVQWDLTNEVLLSNLILSVDADHTAKGIVTSFSRKVTIVNCEIKAAGGREAYGIYGEGAVDILARNSQIKAKAADGAGNVSSIFSEAGSIQSENSVLEPEVPGKTTYQILETKADRPVYVEAGEKPDDWQMPGELEVYVQGSDQEGEEVMTVPATWELPKEGFSEPGYCTVKGRFVTEQMGTELMNPEEIVPEITVLCLPKEKMFLIGYETFDDASVRGVKLLVPYPYDADRLMVETSPDGVNYTRYAVLGDSNILVEGESIRKDGLYGFYIQVSVPGEGLYIRTVVEGNSMFAGTSAPWKVTRTVKDEVPEIPGGDSSGDRGGQDSKPLEQTDDKTDGEAPDQRVDVYYQAGGRIYKSGQEYKESAGAEENSADMKADGRDTGREEADSDSRKAKKKGKKQEEEKQEGDDQKGADQKGEKEGPEGNGWAAAAAAVIGIAVLLALAILCGKKIFGKVDNK